MTTIQKSEYPVSYIPLDKRKVLRDIAKVKGGRALLRELFRYYTADPNSEVRNSMFDGELDKSIRTFGHNNHEEELRMAFAVMRELFDDIFMNDSMRSQAHEELNHVIGGG